MSALTHIAGNTFRKVFINLAKEMEVAVEQVQLGIYYKNGNHVYEAYKDFKKEKDIDLGDYVGTIIDFSGGTEIINMTIAQAGVKYASGLGCDASSINIIMRYKKDSLPEAVLLKDGAKVRDIDIDNEFLQ